METKMPDFRKIEKSIILRNEANDGKAEKKHVGKRNKGYGSQASKLDRKSYH